MVTCGDDRRLVYWNTTTYHEPVKVVPLPVDSCPTAMHFLNNADSSTINTGLDSVSPFASEVQPTISLIAIGTSSGVFYLIPVNWNGNRLDKTVEAHRGAIICLLWSPDNSTIATGGEDGLVKVWSRTGMLRSTIVASNIPIYALSWSACSKWLSIANGTNIAVKSLTPQSRMLEWIAHDGIVLALDWSAANGLILSASEDRRVKMWDSNGQALFISVAHSSPVTSVAWSPDGQLFTIATFCAIKLHETSGSCICVDKLSNEGIHKVVWSKDGNQVCFTCSNGKVFFAYLIDHVHECGVWKVTSNRKSLRLSNITNDMNELVDFSDSIVRISFKYEHLIVVSVTQCYIYQPNNVTTPIHFDIKSLDVGMIKQSHKHFLLVSFGSGNLYNYSGRLMKTFKMTNFKMEPINANSIRSVLSVSVRTVMTSLLFHSKLEQQLHRSQRQHQREHGSLCAHRQRQRQNSIQLL